MRVRFILLCYLLILLVLTLFSVSTVIVFCYFRLLKFIMKKNRWNTVYVSDSIQQERFSVSWKLVKYTFNHWTYLCKDVHCERSKQTINATQDFIAEITYFEINRLCAYIKQIQQADNMQRNPLLIKVQV